MIWVSEEGTVEEISRLLLKESFVAKERRKEWFRSKVETGNFQKITASSGG